MSTSEFRRRREPAPTVLSERPAWLRCSGDAHRRLRACRFSDLVRDNSLTRQEIYCYSADREPNARLGKEDQGRAMQRRFAFGESAVSAKQAVAPDGYAGIYGFHKYWGKKPHEPIAFAIQQLTDPGDLVVDPFLGSGSSAREAIVRNRRFIGFDVNPVAIELAKCITSPPNASALRYAFRTIEQGVKARIFSTYALSSGETATHYLTEGDELKQVWIKGSAKTARRELDPSAHDLSLIDSFSAYRSRFVQSPRFFSNGRINVSADMTLDSLLTPRAQHNVDLLIEAISACPATVRNALLLCMTAASGQMTRMVFAVTGRGKTKGKTAEKVEVGSWVIGYWRPRLHFEVNVWNCFENRVRKLLSALQQMGDTPTVTFARNPQDVIEGLDSCFIGLNDCRRGLKRLPAAACSLVITDPPHSDRVPYLELSAFWNALLGREADFEDEIVISNAKERGKGEREYHSSMSEFFAQAARVLSHHGSLLVFFNARQPHAWTSIRDVILERTENGLVYAGRFPCNYSANSVVQDNRKGAMKRDWALVFGRPSSRRLSGGDHCLSDIPGWTSDPPELLL